MSAPRAFFTITLPQAIRVAIPTSGNDFVGMVKDTSLVGIIGIFELYRTGQKLVSDTFLPFEVWTAWPRCTSSWCSPSTSWSGSSNVGCDLDARRADRSRNAGTTV